MDTLNDLVLDGNGKLDLNKTARQLIESFANAFISALADDFCDENDTSRNGYRERELLTSLGVITLKIPKVRKGSFFPDEVIERWSRTDTALASIISEMWVNGISNRKIEKVAAEMGIEKMSRSKVSRLCKSLDEEITALKEQDLSGCDWPYLWLDATYLNCRETGVSSSVAVVIAVAASSRARRRIVGIECIDTESYMSWRDFLLKLRKRGISGVRLVTSDEHAGLVRAIREILIGSAHQRCIAHLERNVIDRARKKGNGAAAVAALKAAFDGKDPDLVRAGYDKAIEVYREYDEAGANLLEDAREEALAYLAFPAVHRTWIRTNNICERFNGEIKRRANVVQVFPSRESLIRLIGAVCCDQNDTWMAEKWFMAADSIDEINAMSDRAKPSKEEIEQVARKVVEAFEDKLKAA